MSMANAGPNTNGSQFFICTAQVWMGESVGCREGEGEVLIGRVLYDPRLPVGSDGRVESEELGCASLVVFHWCAFTHLSLRICMQTPWLDGKHVVFGEVVEVSNNCNGPPVCIWMRRGMAHGIRSALPTPEALPSWRL